MNSDELLQMNSMAIIDFFGIVCLRFLEMKEDYDRQI